MKITDHNQLLAFLTDGICYEAKPPGKYGLWHGVSEQDSSACLSGDFTFGGISGGGSASLALTPVARWFLESHRVHGRWSSYDGDSHDGDSTYNDDDADYMAMIICIGPHPSLYSTPSLTALGLRDKLHVAIFGEWPFSFAALARREQSLGPLEI